ncbi:MAG: hypothetical protein ACLR2G_04690 [Phascolarctobacterium faecium]
MKTAKEAIALEKKHALSEIASCYQSSHASKIVEKLALKKKN